MNYIDLIRITLSLVMGYLVYTETGIFTGISMALVMVRLEIDAILSKGK